MSGVTFHSSYCQLALGLSLIFYGETVDYLLIVITGVACNGADVVNGWVLMAPIPQIAAN